MNKQARIIFNGTVQGVFFRSNVQQLAQELELVGWVKNEVDGSVKVKAQGKEQDIKQLITKVNQGIGRANVVKFEVFWEDELSNFENFSIKY